MWESLPPVTSLNHEIVSAVLARLRAGEEQRAFEIDSMGPSTDHPNQPRDGVPARLPAVMSAAEGALPREALSSTSGYPTAVPSAPHLPSEPPKAVTNVYGLSASHAVSPCKPIVPTSSTRLGSMPLYVVASQQQPQPHTCQERKLSDPSTSPCISVPQLSRSNSCSQLRRQRIEWAHPQPIAHGAAPTPLTTSVEKQAAAAPARNNGDDHCSPSDPLRFPVDAHRHNFYQGNANLTKKTYYFDDRPLSPTTGGGGGPVTDAHQLPEQTLGCTMSPTCERSIILPSESFYSPTLVCPSNGARVFPLSSSDNHHGINSTVLGVGTYPPAAAATRLTHSTELDRLIRLFESQYERHQLFKSRCTEGYLTSIERTVDQYLVRHYNPSLGSMLSMAGARILQMGTSMFTSAPSTSPSPLPATQSPLPLTMPGREVATGMKLTEEVPTATAPAQASPYPMAPLRYTANVITDHYLDAAPSEPALHQIQANYPILQHALRHLLPGVAAAVEDGSVADPHGAGRVAVDLKEVRAMQQELLLPTVARIWRDYLTPLEAGAQKLLSSAELSLLPLLTRQQQLQETRSHLTANANNSDSRSTGSDGCKPELEPMTQTQTTCQQCKSLQADLDYIRIIRGMDNEFCAACRAAPGAAPQSRQRHSAANRQLSDYVPVYGLILSRLHRLENEHRTVLELWGPPTKQRAQGFLSEGQCRRGD